MRYLKFSLLFLLASCAASKDEISFGKAFSYCTTLFSYWLWIIIASALAIGGGIVLYKQYKKNASWEVGYSVILFVLVALFAAAWLYLPAEIAANTTPEQAARGVYIGR